MGKKQYFYAVYAEVDTETNKITEIVLDPEVMVGGGGDNSVFDVESGVWEKPDWENDRNATLTEVAVNRVLNESPSLTPIAN